MADILIKVIGCPGLGTIILHPTQLNDDALHAKNQKKKHKLISQFGLAFLIDNSMKT